MNEKWIARFWRMAVEVSTWSKDPDRGVGALLVSPDRRQVSWGFNGFPIGIADDPALLGDSQAKLERTVHAELNAVLNAKRDVSGWTLFVTQHPCHHCALAIVQSGVAVVVCPPPKGLESKWCVSHSVAASLLEEAGVQVVRPYPKTVATGRIW